MKKIQKVFAMAVSMLMALVLMVPVFAEGTTYTITINNDKSGHTYQAYQVFDGDLSNDGVLSNIDWGTGVNEEELLTALKADNTIGSYFEKSNTAAEVAEVLSLATKDGETVFSFNSEMIDAFAEVVGNHLGSSSGSATSPVEGKYTISNLDAGYYFVKDAAAVSGQDAQTKFILEVTSDETVTPKSATPTVDKQVHDEMADAEEGAIDGWGETADHAINESFQFKLIATLPDDTDLNAYDYYYVNFVDTWSVGVTFESIASVTVNNTTLSPEQYTITSDSPASGTSMNISINDIVPYLGTGNDLAGSTVTVIYNAHLNENAAVNEASGSTTNKNTVKLEFSNNPYWNGTGTPDKGETPEDTVWVFTYQVNNTKVDASNGNAPLAGAGFKLYSDSECNNEISLTYDISKSAYRPVKGEEKGEEMVSAETTGIFNIVGLDAGTYYLKETTVPDGYNEMSPNPLTVTISATHVETTGETASVTLAQESTMQNNIENKKGSTLPSTGGMGTTVIYTAGVIMVVVAGVLLVVKKRMSSGKGM